MKNVKTNNMISISGYSPLLSSELKIYSLEDNSYLLECNKHQLKINSIYYNLLMLADGKRTIADIVEQFSRIYNHSFAHESIYNLFYVRLAQYGIVLTDQSVVKEKKRSLYLRLSFIFFKGRFLDSLSKTLSPLFKPPFFYASLFIMAVFCLEVLLSYPYNAAHFQSLFTVNGFFSVGVVSFLILLFHEIGHVAACERFGARNKGIGFGFYLFMPVFFADVSDAWKCKKQDRMIINLAGIYIEFIFLTMLLISFLIFNNEILFYSGFAIGLHIFTNVNPFLRYDGYWLLSDGFNIPNLRHQADLRLNKFRMFLLRKVDINFSSLDWWLLIYAISSYFIIVIYLLLLVFFDSTSIFSLPGKIIYFLVNTEWQTQTWQQVYNALFKYTIPIMFYIILGHFTLKNGFALMRSKTKAKL
jgi:putative peptide zinc metalloprotease protein